MTDHLGHNGVLHERVIEWQLFGNGHRAYNPALMCFHSPDTLSPFAKGGLNAYAFCLRDPINAVDPSGQFPMGLLLAGAAVAGAMAAVAASTEDKDVRAVYATVSAMAFIAAPLIAFMPVGGTSLARQAGALLRPGLKGFSTGVFPTPLRSAPIAKSYTPRTSDPTTALMPAPLSRASSFKLNYGRLNDRRNTEYNVVDIDPYPSFHLDELKAGARSSIRSTNNAQSPPSAMRRSNSLTTPRQSEGLLRVSPARSSWSAGDTRGKGGQAKHPLGMTIQEIRRRESTA